MAMLTALLLGLAGPGDIKPITIGDMAPTFKVEGWAKGTPVPALKKGNVYMIEFWATWCGPCIASMPHLSDVADKHKGKATVISINTWDYRGESPGSFEPAADHSSRVKKFVTDNGAKMRYNIALDDKNDTMAKTWMTAAGQNGIPCAFVVDKEGRIAWIGHPMELGDTLEQVETGKWDRAKYKAKFDEERAKAAAEEEKAKAQSEAIAKAAKSGDMNAIDALIKDNTPVEMVIASCIEANAKFGVEVFEAKLDKLSDPVQGISLAAYAAGMVKDADLISRVVKISTGLVDKVPTPIKAVGAIYHARTLFASGDKKGAVEWADKASSFVKDFEPKDAQANVQKYIDSQKAQFQKG